MFDSRRQAGEQLAAALAEVQAENPVVYGLARGGLPVAAPVAAHLNAPLDIILVRKLGAPFQPELAIGAVADGAASASVLHKDRIRDLGIDDAYVKKAETEALAEIARRRAAFFNGHKPVSPKDRVAIIVDDGLATGATMEAAVKSIKSAGAKRIIVAVPVGPIDVVEKFRRLADEVKCLETPDPFWAVGNHYGKFPQLTDNDVIEILSSSDRERGTAQESQSLENSGRKTPRQGDTP